MPSDPARGAERVSWALVGATCVAVLVWLALSDLSFAWSSALLPLLATIGLAVFGHHYGTSRGEVAIGATMVALAQIVAFTMAAAPLSYCLASLARPFWDARLYAVDRALGLDWLAYLRLVNAHPIVGVALNLAYLSLMIQMGVALMALGFSGRLRQLRLFVLAVIASGLVTVIVSGAMPAMAMFVHLGLQQSDYPNLAPAAAHVHVAAMEGLRSGAVRVISLDGAEGLVTFPSYHAALGLIFMWAFWSVPLLRWPGFILNVLLIAATPIDGGHYFADVLAGLAVAAGVLVAIGTAQARQRPAARHEIALQPS